MTPSGEVRPPRLLDAVRDTIRLEHYSLRTEQAYVDWIASRSIPALVGMGAIT